MCALSLSDSVIPRTATARPLCAWYSPGKNPGLLLPPPEDLPGPGLEPVSPVSPARTGGFLARVPPRGPHEQGAAPQFPIRLPTHKPTTDWRATPDKQDLQQPKEEDSL